MLRDNFSYVIERIPHMSVSSRIFKAAALFSAAAIAIVSSGCSGDPVKQEIVTSITDQVQFSYEPPKLSI